MLAPSTSWGPGSEYPSLAFTHKSSHPCSKTDELAKRTAMFTVAGQVGKMFAGAMMAAIHQSMNGYAGLQGWQWVFLIDGIITIPTAIFGYFYFPETRRKTLEEIARAFGDKVVLVDEAVVDREQALATGDVENKNQARASTTSTVPPSGASTS